jgi:hypothetical protein
MKQQLEEALNTLVVDRLPPEARNNLPKIKVGLLKWGELMDGLGRRDEQSGEIFVDESSLHNLLKEHFPEASVQRTIGALQGLPGSKVKKATGKTSVIPWETVAANLGGGQSSSVLSGLNATSSLEEIRAALQQQIPGLPDNLFHAETFTRKLKDALNTSAAGGLQTEAVTGSSWDCMVRHFGFWGALALCAVIAAAATAFIAASIASGGVLDSVFWIFFWPLFLQVGVGGAALATIVTIVGCLFNPSW